MAEIRFKTEWLTQIALLASCGTPGDVADLCAAIQRASQDLPINEMSSLTETLFHPIAESINETRTKSERNRTNRQGKRNENERPLKEKEEEREEEGEVERESEKEKIPYNPLKEKEKEKGEEGEEEKEEEREISCAIALPAPQFVAETDPGKMSDRVLEEEFDALWRFYPRKAGKADALRHYKAARRKGVAYDTIEDGIRRYADYTQGQDPQYIAMGSTWFCGHRWEDQYVRKKSDLERLWDL